MFPDTPSGPGMPVFQKNANVDDGLLVRVGIPHSGGKLAFHAFNEGYAGMVSASAFWNARAGKFRIPEATDLTEIDFALDSAGYTAMKLFQARGRQNGIAEVYPWTFAKERSGHGNSANSTTLASLRVMASCGLRWWPLRRL